MTSILNIITPTCMRSRGKVIGVVCLSSAQKLPNLQIYASLHDVIITTNL